MQTSARDGGGLALDVSILHALIGEDPDVVVQIITTYLGSIGPAAVELRDGVAKRDAKRVRAAAHLIKSPSLSVGALPLGHLCGALERAASDEDWQAVSVSFASFDSTVARLEHAARACIDSNGLQP